VSKNGRKVKANKNNNRNGKESFYSNAINMLKPYYSQDDETTNIERKTFEKIIGICIITRRCQYPGSTIL
jgi:hypothetical protein